MKEIKYVCDICGKKSEDEQFARNEISIDGWLTLEDRKKDYKLYKEVCDNCREKIEAKIEELKK